MSPSPPRQLVEAQRDLDIAHDLVRVGTVAELALLDPQSVKVVTCAQAMAAHSPHDAATYLQGALATSPDQTLQLVGSVLRAELLCRELGAPGAALADAIRAAGPFRSPVATQQKSKSADGGPALG